MSDLACICISECPQFNHYRWTEGRGETKDSPTHNSHMAGSWSGSWYLYRERFRHAELQVLLLVVSCTLVWNHLSSEFYRGERNSVCISYLLNSSRKVLKLYRPSSSRSIYFPIISQVSTICDRVTQWQSDTYLIIWWEGRETLSLSLWTREVCWLWLWPGDCSVAVRVWE